MVNPDLRRAFPKLAFSAVALALVFVRGRNPDLVPSDAVTIGLAFIALLPWLSAFIDTAEFPGGWKFAFKRLAERTESLETELDVTRGRVQQLILSSMSPKTLLQLIKIRSGNFGKYWLGVGLSRELSYLENIGYITFKSPYKGIDDIPQDGSNTPKNLSDYALITPQGIEYLELRKLIAPDEMKALEAMAGANA